MSNPLSRGSLHGTPAKVAFATLVAFFVLSAETASGQTSAPAADREAEARAHFRLSESHYELGHFAEAAAELERAYALSPRPDLLYNLYVARRDAGQLRAAASALRQYLAEGQNIENAALLRHRLAALEAQLANGEEPATVAGADARQAEASASTAGEPDAAGDSAAPDPAPPEETVGAMEPARAEPARSPSPVGYALLGVGAAGLVAGLVTGPLALDRYGALEATCGVDRRCPAGTEGALDEGLALATSTDVLLIGGGVLATVGVVLLFTLLDEAPAAPPVSASCDLDGCRALASLSF